MIKYKKVSLKRFAIGVKLFLLGMVTPAHYLQELYYLNPLRSQHG
jgi:hypothetical protein